MLASSWVWNSSSLADAETTAEMQSYSQEDTIDMGIIGKILGTTKSTGGSQGGKGVTPKKKSVPKPNILNSQSGTKKK